MTLHLFNTLGRQKQKFKPIKKGKVGFYTCGPTVYDYAHIGNLRSFVFADILKRVLQYNNYTVKQVMNLTDVGHLVSDADEGEDKMEKGSRRTGKTAWEIAKFYALSFKKDLVDLNIILPNTLCRATDYIKEQIALIKKLEKKGFTYKIPDGIYFDTSKIRDYGKLVDLRHQDLQAGYRVNMGGKKNTSDFALWKFSPKFEKRQMEWKSPWGIGFPGWHAECSAMAVKYLGQPFDIHSGGIDLASVHHTNEIAQSEAAEGKPMANYWIHSEFLNLENAKMSKSDGNFITLLTLTEKGYLPLAYRYFLLQSHYRKQTIFSFEALNAAQKGLEHLYFTARNINKKAKASKETKEIFLNFINNDLDTPGALAFVWEKTKERKIDLKTFL